MIADPLAVTGCFRSMRPVSRPTPAVMPRGRRLALLPLLCYALALGGCAQVPATDTDGAETRAAGRVDAPVWPKPPAPARIRFVRNVAAPAEL